MTASLAVTSRARARLLFVVCALAGLTIVPNHAQAPATQTVDFVAFNAEAGPVADLTASQVVLKVGGKERKITSLELVRFDSGSNPLPLPFATNVAGDAGRSFVIVVDEESMAPGTERPVREALTTFAASLPVGDPIGLFTVPRGSQSLAPTTDRAAFKAAVAAIQGRNAVANTSRTVGASSANSGCHGRDVLVALSSIINATSRPMGPTPIVLFSLAVAAPDTTVSGLTAGSTQTAVMQSQTCKLTPREFQVLGQSADAARSQFYVVRPEEGEVQGLSEGLETIVGATGGKMLALGRSTDDAMVRIARETSAYYVATFAVEPDERNGVNHKLEVRSTRADVTLRSRPTLLLPKAERGDASTPQAMLRTAAVQTGFGLRSAVVASRNDGDTRNTIKLVGLAEPIDPAVKVTAAAAGVYDKAGKLVAQWTAKPEELQRSLFAAALAVPSGMYRVRVAAVDAQGRAATSDSDINAETVSAGVANLGGLLVGTANPGFMPQLQFSKEPEATVYFELYGRPAGQFEAIVELADSLNGPAIVSAPPTPAATAVADRFMFTAKLPIASLKPGDYLVRAKITFPGQPTGLLQRTIRKR
jgi:hypothetical protein